MRFAGFLIGAALLLAGLGCVPGEEDPDRGRVLSPEPSDHPTLPQFHVPKSYYRGTRFC